MANRVAERAAALTPGDVLASVLAPVLPGVNVYSAPMEQVKAPALVIRPDDPWIQPGPALGALREQWVAAVVAPAGDVKGAMRTIRSVFLTVLANLPPDWAFRDTGRPLVYDAQGTPILGAAARLSYVED